MMVRIGKKEANNQVSREVEMKKTEAIANFQKLINIRTA